MQKNKKTQKSKTKKILLLVLPILIVVSAVIFFLWFNNSSDNNSDAASSDKINFNPPTKEEAAQGDIVKDEIVKENNGGGPSGPTPDASNTTVLITDAAQYDDVIEVRAFMPNHYEDGTCKITFSQSNVNIVKETPAYRDATTTICTNPLIKRSEFRTSGSWDVQVAYTAPGGSGTSVKQSIEIR